MKWARLPRALLELVYGLVMSLTDLRRARRTCRSWRAVLAPARVIVLWRVGDWPLLSEMSKVHDLRLRLQVPNHRHLAALAGLIRTKASACRVDIRAYNLGSLGWAAISPGFSQGVRSVKLVCSNFSLGLVMSNLRLARDLEECDIDTQSPFRKWSSLCQAAQTSEDLLAEYLACLMSKCRLVRLGTVPVATFLASVTNPNLSVLRLSAPRLRRRPLPHEAPDLVIDFLQRHPHLTVLCLRSHHLDNWLEFRSTKLDCVVTPDRVEATSAIGFVVRLVLARPSVEWVYVSLGLGTAEFDRATFLKQNL